MSECNNSNCPPKIIPLVKVEKEQVQAFKYAQLVKNGSSTKKTEKINKDESCSAHGAPGCTRTPPRNNF